MVQCNHVCGVSKELLVHVFRLARLSGDVKGISRLDVVIIFFQNTILYHGFVSLGASNQPEDLALFF